MTPKPRTSAGASTSTEIKAQYAGSSKRKAEEELREQPTKRVDTSKGTLWMMSEMPLDILHEIFKYLEPYDLLRLARTTRALRAILMRPYAKEIWHSSFATIQGPFPPCPDDLNEPQWANLMFSNHCHECGIEPSGKRGTLFMFMEARTQLCAKCSQKKFLKWQDLPVKIPESLQIITPATTKAFKKGRGSRSKLNKFHLDTALEMFNQYTRFGGDLARRNAWFQQQRANCDKVSEHAALCEEYVRWAEEEAKKRRQAEKGDFTQVKEKRFNAICSRLPQWLDEIGFTESDEIREMEDLAVPNFFHHELVNVPVELTDNEWERIRPQLVDWLERVVRPKCILFNSLVAMEGRIRRWVSLVYVNWAVLQLNALPLPSLSEVVLMEEFRAPLENNDLVDEVIIEAAMDALQAFVDKWRRSKEEELLTIVRNSSVYSAPGAEEVDRGTLLLASTAFLCRTCAQTFIYPSILTHGCRTAGDETMEAFKALRTSLGLPDDGPSPSFIGPSNQSQTDNQYPRGFVPWRAVSWFGILRVNSQRIQFSDTAYHHTRALLRQCDMPYTTTHVELKEADPHFQGKCPQFRDLFGEENAKCLKWHNVYSALPHNQKSNYTKCLAVLSKEDVEAVTEAATSIPKAPMSSEAETERRDCFICGGATQKGSRLDKSEYLDHLELWHEAKLGPARRYTQILFDRTLSAKYSWPIVKIEKDWM